MLNGDLGNGGNGRKISAMHAKVMAEDIAQNPPLLQPPIDCLLPPPNISHHPLPLIWNSN